MYRTDKQFMKDPTTAHSRIYIGNIAETVVAENLEQKFKVHGKILGLVLQRGFGFIQYQNEFQAKQAIEAEHGSAFYGRKLNVKQAYAQSPVQNVPNKQFNYQPHNNQPPNPHLPLPQNFERPRPDLREPEREAPRPGPPQEQQQQQPLPPSPQKHQPPQHQNLQQYPQNDGKKENPISEDSGPVMVPAGNESGGGPPASTGASPMVASGPASGGGGFPAGGGSPIGRGGPPAGAGAPPIVANGPATGGFPLSRSGATPGVGEPPLGSGGPPTGIDKPDKRGKKRRRGGGRDRELDRHGLPMDYR